MLGPKGTFLESSRTPSSQASMDRLLCGVAAKGGINTRSPTVAPICPDSAPGDRQACHLHYPSKATA